MTFKIGSKVKINPDSSSSTSHKKGWKAVIISSYNGSSRAAWNVQYEDGGTESWYQDNLTLINNSMDIKEKFTLAFKKEPEKSFRKAGITNGDDFLTEDGQLIFLGWLLKKHGDEFKTDVVDGLLEDQEKDKKSE